MLKKPKSSVRESVAKSKKDVDLDEAKKKGKKESEEETDDAEDEEFDPMEMYHDWVSDRAMSIFSSGATSEEAMFMARQEAAHLFPDEHREAMTPPHYKAQAAQAAKAQPGKIELLPCGSEVPF